MSSKPALRIAAVTGSRADWGLLAPVLELLRDDPSFDLRLIVTGQHLILEDSSTSAAIEADGFQVAARVDMQLGQSSAESVTRALGQAVMGFGGALQELAPDLLLVLGDRYEILAAVQAALIAQVPVAHLCGGDITRGAIDDAIRHSITKMAHLHFPSNELAAARIRQMGEESDRVFCVGSPGIDRIKRTQTLERDAFFKTIEFGPFKYNILVTCHPVTLDADPAAQAKTILEALDQIDPQIGIILTGTNADPGGDEVGRSVAAFVKNHKNARLFSSLGSTLYFSALRHVNAVVGNSSSGLYEAPSFGIPTVNVGDRQEGRLKASSVIDCPSEAPAIVAAIESALAMDCRDTQNPYGDGNAAERIIAVLKTVEDPKRLLRKTFAERSQIL